MREGNRAGRILPSQPWASRAETSRCRQAARDFSWVQDSARARSANLGVALAVRAPSAPGSGCALAAEVPPGLGQVRRWRGRGAGGRSATSVSLTAKPWSYTDRSRGSTNTRVAPRRSPGSASSRAAAARQPVRGLRERRVGDRLVPAQDRWWRRPPARPHGRLFQMGSPAAPSGWGRARRRRTCTPSVTPMPEGSILVAVKGVASSVTCIR